MSIPEQGADGAGKSFQERVVGLFRHVCTEAGDPTDLPERRDRFGEEAMEIFQATHGTREAAHQIVDYVFSREKGQPRKEIGQGLVTLTALATHAGHDLMACGEEELARMWRPESVEKVRRKRAARHGRGPLPGLDAALATPRTDSAERTAGDVLAEACKPWDLCFGDPPDYDSPLHGVFVAGMIYTERLLAGLVGVSDYEHGDGSEDFDADATQSLRNILTGAGLWDADENRPATPALSSPGVPDSVRALSEAATPGRWEAGDGRANGSFNYVYSDDATGSAIATFALSHVYRVEKTTRANAQFAAAAVNFVRSLISAHPAGQSTGQGAEPIAEDFLRRADVMAACAEMADHTADMALYGDPEHAQRREAMEATATRLRAMFQHMPAARPAPDTHLTGPVGVEHAQLISDLMDFHDALNGGVGNGAITIRCESETDQTRRNFRAVLREAAAALAARPAAPEAQGASITCDVLTMRLSDGRADYFTRIKCGDRDMTIFKFGDRYKAQYSADEFAWLLGLRPDKPDMMAYSEASHPNEPAPPSSGQGGR